MVKAFIREATAEDAVEVALNIRAADRDELWASGRNIPISCLIRAHKLSTGCKSLVIDGKVACIFGVAPLSMLGSIGSPWMIGTDLIEKHPKTFLRKCQNSVLAMTESYGTLLNYVDARNVMAIKWLSWLGFHVQQAVPYGPFKMPFHKFELRK